MSELAIPNGTVLRMMTLMTHYRQPLNFTADRMAEARKVLQRWLRAVEPCEDQPPLEVVECLMEDINTLKAIALMHGYRAKKEGRKLFAAMRFLGLFDGDLCCPDDWRTIPRDHQVGGFFEGPDGIGVA